jgi:2-(1,2-epoxy-1,2-dihydrophenyl)acetyl-CoA isomerase
MTYHNLIMDFADDIAIFRINRPDHMNALSIDLLSEIRTAIDHALTRNIRAILITGEGRAFSAGADLTDDQSLTADLGETLEAAYHPLFRHLMAIDIPIISAINGPAVGAGAVLALAADISVMARSAYLQFGFVNIGLVPDSGLTWLLARSVGRVRAFELALLGERIDAGRAQAIGLVTRLADDDRCLADAMAVARRLASGPVIAIGLIRRQIAQALDAGYEDVLAIERENQSKAGKTDDFREGISAFREKRIPDFKGH